MFSQIKTKDRLQAFYIYFLNDLCQRPLPYKLNSLKKQPESLLQRDLYTLCITIHTGSNIWVDRKAYNKVRSSKIRWGVFLFCLLFFFSSRKSKL